MTVTRTCASRIRSRSSEARYHWIFSPLKRANSLEQRADLEFGALLGEQHPPRTHRRNADRPCSSSSDRRAGRCRWRSSSSVSPTVQKLKQTNTELPLQAGAVAVGFQASLDRVADVGGDVLEVGKPLGIARHAIAVILDREVMRAVLAAARDRDGLCVRVDAVLDELGNRLERIALRQRDDANRIPVIPDLELAAVAYSWISWGAGLTPALRRAAIGTTSGQRLPDSVLRRVAAYRRPGACARRGSSPPSCVVCARRSGRACARPSRPARVRSITSSRSIWARLAMT